MNLFIDIETIPAQKVVPEIEVLPPGNMSKPETIAQWEQDKKPALVEQEWRKTALDGTFGEIICIAWAVDDDLVAARYRELDESEGDMLATFFIAMDTLFNTQSRSRKPIWTGHNITGFDLRFIWQRCVVNNVQPTIRIPYNAKPWGDDVFDTMIEWKGLGARPGGSLDNLCLALGIPGKGDITGANVWDYVKAGKIKDVAKYCMEDVERVRQIHQRMRRIS